jgi:hypothetical protein
MGVTSVTSPIVVRVERRRKEAAKRVRKYAHRLKNRGGARLTITFDRVDLMLLRNLAEPGESLAAVVRRAVLAEIKRRAGV